jgi:fatty acid desaturase
MILRLSQLKVLDGYKLRDKQRILSNALEMLPVAQKIMLRIAKLSVLIPFFIALAYVEGWILLPILLLAGLSYPLLTSPIEIFFSKSTIEQAEKQFNSKEHINGPE